MGGDISFSEYAYDWRDDGRLTQGDQKVLLLATGQSDGQNSMSILLDYGATKSNQP